MKFLILNFLFLFSLAQAQDDPSNFGGLGAGGKLCDSIFKSGNWGCGEPARANSLGGSYPLLFDGFNVNPSALPTFGSPWGVEIFSGDGKFNAALLKGFGRLGSGLSVKKTDSTFFSSVDNAKVALKRIRSDYVDSSLDNIVNLGSAIDLLDIPKIISLPLGLSMRLNQQRNSITPVFGSSFKTTWLNLGWSFYREKPDPYTTLGDIEVQEIRKETSLVAGLKIASLLVDYTFTYFTIDQQYKFGASGETYKSRYMLITHILSGSLKVGSILLTAGYRSQDRSGFDITALNTASTELIPRSHVMMGIAYKASRFSIGLYHNYVVEDPVSLIGQIYF